MKLKKTAVFLAAAMMAVTSFAFPASANNHGDTRWEFHFFTGNPEDINTLPRDKNDASGSYVDFRYCDYDQLVDFKVIGRLYNGNWEDCTKNKGVATVSPGQKRRIRQYVYEWGYPQCFLSGDKQEDGQGSANGFWSPDSVGSDPYAN